MTLEKAIEKLGWVKLCLAAACVLKRRAGIPESEEFHAGEKQLEELFSSLTKRQIKLLCKIAAGFEHIEKVPLH